MNTITQLELLEYWFKDAKDILNSQHCDIDENYKLTNADGININPKIEIDDSLKDIVIINIKYQIMPEHINITELNMSKPKFISRGNEIYNFKKVIK